MVVGGGYWYVRNLIVSGNPFPWQDIGPIHHAEALQGRHPYSIAHYATDTSVWGRYFTPALHERLGELWPAYLALAVIAVLLVLWRGGRMERMLAAVALLAAIAYLLTPLGASGPGGHADRLPAQHPLPGAGAGPRAHPAGDPATVRRRAASLAPRHPGAALAARHAGDLRRPDRGQRRSVGAIDTGRIPGTAALALARGRAAAAAASSSRAGGSRRCPLPAIGLAALIALAIFGRMAQTHYLDERYSSTAPDYPKTEQPAVELGQGLGAAYDWARRHPRPQDRALGDHGRALPVPRSGVATRATSVTYIGKHGPRGSFNEIPECPEWIGALNDGGYDYVVTTPTFHQDDPAADTAPVQRDWISHGGTSSASRAQGWSTSGRSPGRSTRWPAPRHPVRSSCRLLPSREWPIRSTTRSSSGRRAPGACESSTPTRGRPATRAAPWMRSARSSAAGSARPSQPRSWPISTAAAPTGAWRRPAAPPRWPRSTWIRRQSSTDPSSSTCAAPMTTAAAG